MQSLYRCKNWFLCFTSDRRKLVYYMAILEIEKTRIDSPENRLVVNIEKTENWQKKIYSWWELQGNAILSKSIWKNLLWRYSFDNNVCEWCVKGVWVSAYLAMFDATQDDFAVNLWILWCNFLSLMNYSRSYWCFDEFYWAIEYLLNWRIFEVWLSGENPCLSIEIF